MSTMKGRSNAITEMLSRRLIDICWVQESRSRGASAREIAGKSSYYKIYLKGEDFGSGDVGELVAGKWVDKVISVVRHSTRLIILQ